MQALIAAQLGLSLGARISEHLRAADGEWRLNARLVSRARSSLDTLLVTRHDHGAGYTAAVDARLRAL